MGFHTEFWEFRELRIFENYKNNSFSSGQAVVQNQTKLCMEYHQCKESVKQKKISYTLSGKNLLFHTELFELREKGILKKDLFHRVKELSKSNQTRCGVWPV